MIIAELVIAIGPATVVDCIAPTVVLCDMPIVVDCDMPYFSVTFIATVTS